MNMFSHQWIPWAEQKTIFKQCSSVRLHSAYNIHCGCIKLPKCTLLYCKHSNQSYSQHIYIFSLKSCCGKKLLFMLLLQIRLKILIIKRIIYLQRQKNVYVYNTPSCLEIRHGMHIFMQSIRLVLILSPLAFLTRERVSVSQNV